MYWHPQAALTCSIDRPPASTRAALVMAALGMTAMYLLMVAGLLAVDGAGVGGVLHQLRHGGAVAGILVPQLYQRLIVVLAYPVPDVDSGGHTPVL